MLVSATKLLRGVAPTLQGCDQASLAEFGRRISAPLIGARPCMQLLSSRIATSDRILYAVATDLSSRYSRHGLEKLMRKVADSRDVCDLMSWNQAVCSVIAHVDDVPARPLIGKGVPGIIPDDAYVVHVDDLMAMDTAVSLADSMWIAANIADTRISVSYPAGDIERYELVKHFKDYVDRVVRITREHAAYIACSDRK